MKRIIRFAKAKLPKQYEYYQHLKRKRLIKKIDKLKSLSLQQHKQILSKMYKEKFGREIDWKAPKTYTEKMQIDKLFNSDPRKTVYSDKYLVRDWIENTIGKEYLIPLLGAWDSFEEIDFSNLPNQFVLKTNHGSGTNLIVKDKGKMDMKEARRKFNDWMAMDFAYMSRFELHYSKIKRKIVAEQYLQGHNGELQDYKFLCFHGKPVFCWVDLGRFTCHTRTVFDMNWNLQPWTQEHYGISENPIPEPKNFVLMKELATRLSQGFAQVRVDFYNIEGKVYFGEMTFTNGSGFDPIVPEEYDTVLGGLWDISAVIKYIE